MSLELAALQCTMVKAILARDDEAPSAIEDLGDEASRRLAINRNTVLDGLCEALRLTYPLTELVVGTPFFEQAALAFARVTPPVDPVLAQYGAAFPAFLDSLEVLADLSYVPDLARLEWEVDQASYGTAEDGHCATLHTTKGLAAIALVSSLRLLAVGTTVLPLWQALQAGDEAALGCLDWKAAPQWLAVYGVGDRVGIMPISEGAWRLAAALLAGKDFDEADERCAIELLSAPFARINFADPAKGRRKP